MVLSLFDLHPIMRASYRQIHHHFSEQASKASHEMRALIMINSGSRSPPDHGLVILHKTYLTEERRKWPVMLDESTSPEEIKYPHFVHDNSTYLSVNFLQTNYSCWIFRNTGAWFKEVLIFSDDNIIITEKNLKYKSFLWVKFFVIFNYSGILSSYNCY